MLSLGDICRTASNSHIQSDERVSSFNITNLPLSGLKLVNRKRLGDQRGFLSRLFCVEELAAVGWSKPFKSKNAFELATHMATITITNT